MAILSDEAVVLARVDYSETSQVIVLFTRANGKVRAIAKGIKRNTKTRFATGIDLIDMGHVTLNARPERSASLATVTEWKQTRSLSGLREKLDRIRAAQYIAEITGHLTEDWDPHPNLYDATIVALEAISEASAPLRPVVAFQRQLLQAVGSAPRLDACALCGRGIDLTQFSSFEGGPICRHCEPAQVEKWPLSVKTLCLLRTGKVTEASSDTVISTFALLDYHIAHLMGRGPRLASQLVPSSRRRTTGAASREGPSQPNNA
jgi:DNA repair protein RecO (recombination protein O)